MKYLGVINSAAGDFFEIQLTNTFGTLENRPKTDNYGGDKVGDRLTPAVEKLEKACLETFSTN